MNMSNWHRSPGFNTDWKSGPTDRSDWLLVPLVVGVLGPFVLLFIGLALGW